MKVDYNHYLHSKYLQKIGNEDINFNWKDYLFYKKQQYNDFNFIVLSESTCLFSEAAIGSEIIFNEKSVFLDLKLPETVLYIIFVGKVDTDIVFSNQNSGKVFFDFINLNFCTINLEIDNKNELSVYHQINNLTDELFLNKINIKNYQHLRMHLLENKDYISKNKIELYIQNFLNSNSFVYYSLKTPDSCLRYDSIEVKHIEGNTKSSINYFNINKGKSISQLNNVVLKDSKNCEVFQKIRHVISSPKAQSFSVPNLVIENNEVIASHGNIISPLAKEDLFYLTQRGISNEKASQLIENSKLMNSCFEDAIALEYFKGTL